MLKLNLRTGRIISNHPLHRINSGGGWSLLFRLIVTCDTVTRIPNKRLGFAKSKGM